MKNAKANRAKNIYYVLLAINIFLLFGMTVFYFQAQKPYRAVESHDLDLEFLEAREILKKSEWEYPSVGLKEEISKVYWNWNLITSFPNKFGYLEFYSEEERKLNIIIGNFYGTEVITVEVPNAYGTKVVEMTDFLSSKDNIIMEDGMHKKFLSFFVDGKNYLVDSNLNIWKLESPFEETKIVRFLKKLM